MPFACCVGIRGCVDVCYGTNGPPAYLSGAMVGSGLENASLP